MPYHLTYKFDHHPEALSKEEAMKITGGGENGGACDAALFISIMLPEDGGMSTLFIDVDGRTGEELSPAVMFQLWVLMASKIAEDPDSSDAARQMAGGVFNHVKDMVAANKG